jgi:predicted amidohydrolase
MRVLIRDGVLVDGTGRPRIERASVVIEDHRIAGITDVRATAYDRADLIIEAHGGFVLPGILDHHAHGMTRGPLMITGEPALSDARARFNRRRLIREGVTRVANVDGFAVVEEGRAASTFPGITVVTTSLHTPRHIQWATEGQFSFGGIQAHHHSTLEEELRLGAVAIGEIGPGIDHHWIDYTIVPVGLANAGGRADATIARDLRVLVEADDLDGARALLDESDSAMTVGQLVELLAAARAWCDTGREACEEALSLAEAFDVPVIMHHTPTTYELVLEAAATLGERLICAHSNFQVLDPQVAVEHAMELRRHGARIDVMTGDVDGARQFLPDDAVTHALMKSGCVDLISTDYAGGFWDSMLSVVERADAAGALPLEDGIRAVTGRVAESLPLFAPSRGTLEPGNVADVVVTEPQRLSQISTLLVSGIPVSLSGELPPA